MYMLHYMWLNSHGKLYKEALEILITRGQQRLQHFILENQESVKDTTQFRAGWYISIIFLAI